MPNDLDFNGHVTNGRYFTLADLGRLDFAIRTGSARIAIQHTKPQDRRVKELKRPPHASSKQHPDEAEPQVHAIARA